MIIGVNAEFGQAQELPKGQARTVLTPAMKDDKWREEEIHRFVAGQQNHMMDGKKTSYLGLVLFPLLLYILGLAVVRRRDF